MDKTKLKTKIGLEIHVQLATKSKMFCRCDNQSFAEATDGKQSSAKAPNTVVCPICLGMPGTLPVANKKAIESTLKTGLVLNCKINSIAKFDRKHYFYPDLPKGYQISQYDEPFCSGGFLEIDGKKIRLNRIHLEEDAGKLIHSNCKSLVDLNRAGTPLMEIVTEPDIETPEQAGAFLRKLQKIVRDEAKVSEASMEKGHLRCDANISVNDGDRMSEIVELKNINSFRFIEKALAIEEERLRSEYPNWAEKKKVTRGYDSKKNETYPQRQKEEAADYRYFPEPDLPPFESSQFDLESLKSAISKSHEERLDEYLLLEIAQSDAGVLISDAIKDKIFAAILKEVTSGNEPLLAKAIVHNYFGFAFNESDYSKSKEYGQAIDDLAKNTITKQVFTGIVKEIHEAGVSYKDTFSKSLGEGAKIDLGTVIDGIIEAHPNELLAYKAGKAQLFGFFMGEAMRATGGKANPKDVSRIFKEKLS